MLRTRIPTWILIGGFALSAIAGSINIVGFLSVYRMPISHMSGTVSNLGMEAAAWDIPLLSHSLHLLLFFFGGAMLSGIIIRQSSLRVGRRYGVVLTLESVLLVFGTLLLRRQSPYGLYVASMACGLQNAMASSYSGAVIRTSHMTGMITDLGIACGHVLRRQRVEWRRFRLYGILLTGFCLGSYLGALLYPHYGYNTLLLPAFLAGCAGIGNAAVKHWERQASRRAALPPAEHLKNGES